MGNKQTAPLTDVECICKDGHLDIKILNLIYSYNDLTIKSNLFEQIMRDIDVVIENDKVQYIVQKPNVPLHKRYSIKLNNQDHSILVGFGSLVNST
jgi:hypothetical protein